MGVRKGIAWMKICKHGNEQELCETCAAWESAIYNQRRAEKAEQEVSLLKETIRNNSENKTDSKNKLEAISNSNEEVKKREEYVIGGLLRKDMTDDGELAVYTYTDQTTFERAWDKITLNSRGHVYNVRTGERVACLFSKFFNLNERDCRYEVLPWDKPYEVYEKMDGWIGGLFRHKGKFWVSTRGSFHSDGSKWASSFIQHKDLSFLPDEVTLVFEIITPEQKIILDYKGERTLYVLAAFNRHTGEEYQREQVEIWAKEAGLPIVEIHRSMTIQDCLKMKDELKDREGFVIRFHDGKRVKVKTEWYCAIAKIMANLTPISVWECMGEGKVKQEYLRSIPEELKPLVDKYKNELESQFVKIRKILEITLIPLIEANKDSRKSFAMSLSKKTAIIKKAAFSFYDRKEEAIEKIVMDLIYPKSNNLVNIEQIVEESGLEQ